MKEREQAIGIPDTYLQMIMSVFADGVSNLQLQQIIPHKTHEIMKTVDSMKIRFYSIVLVAIRFNQFCFSYQFFNGVKFCRKTLRSINTGPPNSFFGYTANKILKFWIVDYNLQSNQHFITGTHVL